MRDYTNTNCRHEHNCETCPHQVQVSPYYHPGAIPDKILKSLRVLKSEEPLDNEIVIPLGELRILLGSFKVGYLHDERALRSLKTRLFPAKVVIGEDKVIKSLCTTCSGNITGCLEWFGEYIEMDDSTEKKKNNKQLISEYWNEFLKVYPQLEEFDFKR